MVYISWIMWVIISKMNFWKVLDRDDNDDEKKAKVLSLTNEIQNKKNRQKIVFMKNRQLL